MLICLLLYFIHVIICVCLIRSDCTVLHRTDDLRVWPRCVSCGRRLHAGTGGRQHISTLEPARRGNAISEGSVGAIVNNTSSIISSCITIIDIIVIIINIIIIIITIITRIFPVRALG